MSRTNDKNTQNPVRTFLISAPRVRALHPSLCVLGGGTERTGPDRALLGSPAPTAHSPSARPQPHSRQAQIARDGPRARRGGSSRCSSGPDLGVAELHHHILAAPARRHLKPPQQRPDAGLGGPGKGAGAEGCACALRAATSRGGRWGL